MTPADMQGLCDLASAECTELRAEIDLQTVEIGKQRTALTSLGEMFVTLRAELDGYILETQRLRRENTPRKNLDTHELCSRLQRREAKRKIA